MDIIATITIALLTFLWYRKGRLWNFYDSITRDAINQIKSNSIDRKAWEKMARDHCDSLGKDLFNSLFRFEIEYLRNNLINNQYSLWIPDSESDGKKSIIYTDKEKYACFRLKKAFFEDFRYCGFRLFINSFIYYLTMKDKKEDTGYIETHHTK
jgi:hypothetical protein